MNSVYLSIEADAQSNRPFKQSRRQCFETGLIRRINLLTKQ